MASFTRTSFGLAQAVRPELQSAYASRLVQLARQKQHRLDFGAVHFHLPEFFGFCHGVARAVQLAYETRQCYPEARLFITDEIVHNPLVNRRLLDLGYHFLYGRYADGTTLAELSAGDVILLPAFGVEADEVERIKRTGAFIVDTTCGEVMSVWKQVYQYTRDGYTVAIHGSYDHQETRATASRIVNDDPLSTRHLPQSGHYLIVRDLAEADQVCRFVEGDLKRATLLPMLQGKTSPEFDPDRDLERVGIANQTTMLARETLAIQARFHVAFIRRYGEQEAARRFRAIDTICSATQERQDAIGELISSQPDLLIVVGGYNSANTHHLVELGATHGVATYHLSDDSCLVDRNTLRRWDAQLKQEVTVSSWWPDSSPLHVGFAAGASTPDSTLGAVMLRVLELTGIAPDIELTSVPVESVLHPVIPLAVPGRSH